MKNIIFNEITLSIILIILALLFLDPFMLWMPPQAVYILVGLTVAVFAVFVGLVWKERAQDEREDYHRMLAGRIGFIVGSGIIIAGIIWQTFNSSFDPWLVAALVGMILGKLTGLHYAGNLK